MSRKVSRSSRNDLAVDTRVLKNMKFNDELNRGQQFSQPVYHHLNFNSMANMRDSRHTISFQKEEQAPLSVIKNKFEEETKGIENIESKMEFSPSSEGVCKMELIEEKFHDQFSHLSMSNSQIQRTKAFSNVLRHYAGSKELANRTDLWRLYLQEYVSKP